LNKRFGSSAAISGFSLQGALALLAGSGLLIGAAISSQEPSRQTPGVKVTLSSWSYLTSIPLSFEQAPLVNEVALGLDDESFPQEAARVKFDKPLVAKRITRLRRKAVAASVSTQDQVATTQAVEVSIVTNEVTAEQASEVQLEAFRSMHRQLRAQFLIATRHHEAFQPALDQVATRPLNTQEPTPVAAPTREVAAVAVAEPETESHLNPADLAAAVAVTFSEGEEGELSQVVSDVAQIRRQDLTGQATRRAKESQLSPEDSDQEDAQEQIDNTLMSSAHSYTLFQEQTQSAYQQIEELSRQAFGSNSERVTTQAVATQATQTTLTQSGVSVRALSSRSDGYSQRAEYSTQDLFNIWQSWNVAHQAQAIAPQPKEPKAPSSVTTLAQGRNQQLVEVADVETVFPDDASHGLLPSVPLVVEAFEWNTPVQTTDSHAITLEGWSQVLASDHWPVIYWNPSGQSQAPMISHNTAVMLAHYADTQLQPGAAIVFGKIPAGWDVEFSDRAEKVVYLNGKNRYFAFVNAAPGAQLVTLKAALGAETAAVAVPVLSGTSTYVDLTSVSKRVFSGHVLDASAAERKGVAGATVDVVGQANAVFFTTESGYFHLSEVYVVGDYPVYVESTMPAGFKHRYRVTPGKMDDIELFHLGDKQVREWLAQLEGGVSPVSGLIVAAVPGLIRSYGDGRLFPSVRTLLSDSTLSPETYTVSSEGELDAGAPLEAIAPRFVSVQIPTGPVVSQVEDNNRNVVWSQLVFAQPGVINVVGPY
jgi:hypothetical protein